MQAIEAFIESQGGPEVIDWREVALGEPGPGQLLVRHTAVGLNYLDTYHRNGTYPVPLPSGLGVEAAAAALLKACTVEALVERCAKVEAGWPVLVHAAAGGVGLILVQWLKAIGATVIGTVSTEAKEAAAREAGADHVIRYKEQDVAAHVREITDGQGVPVTFDGIGMTTWNVSLKATARRGLIAVYGNAGGPLTGVDINILAQHGALFVTRPSLFDYYLDSGERAAGAARVFEMLESGAVTVRVGQRYALEDAARAHADLEAGRTTGSSLLIPEPR